MIYLIVQTFILLLISGLLGLILGWYLTRISAANSSASLRALLGKAKGEARELRAELDALTTAKNNCDSERRLLSDELAQLRARVDAADSAGKDEMIAALQGELDQCRQSLADDGAVVREEPEPEAEVEVDAAAIATAASSAAAGAGALMSGAPGDDLQQIRGIGPKIAGILKELDIERFDQIAAWTSEDVDRVNAHLKFKGRVEREDWIPQAKKLIAARDD